MHVCAIPGSLTGHPVTCPRISLPTPPLPVQRMHLLTFLQFREPGPLMRGTVLLGQGAWRMGQALGWSCISCTGSGQRMP